jgi:hypothetical protein
MNRLHLAGVTFGVVAVALALAFGPLAAGYLLAGVAFALMFGLMAANAGHAIGNWRLDHPMRIPHWHKRSRA